MFAYMLTRVFGWDGSWEVFVCGDVPVVCTTAEW